MLLDEVQSRFPVFLRRVPDNVVLESGIEAGSGLLSIKWVRDGGIRRTQLGSAGTCNRRKSILFEVPRLRHLRSRAKQTSNTGTDHPGVHAQERRVETNYTKYAMMTHFRVSGVVIRKQCHFCCKDPAQRVTK